MKSCVPSSLTAIKRPSSPHWPAERVNVMLKDSVSPFLLTQGKLLEEFSITALENMKSATPKTHISPVEVTAPRPPVADFDTLPLPNHSTVDYDAYHKQIGIAMAKHTISLQATRGCPFNCTYCHKIWSRKHVFRRAGEILAEMSFCYEPGMHALPNLAQFELRDALFISMSVAPLGAPITIKIPAVKSKSLFIISPLPVRMQR